MTARIRAWLWPEHPADWSPPRTRLIGTHRDLRPSPPQGEPMSIEGRYTRVDLTWRRVEHDPPPPLLVDTAVQDAPHDVDLTDPIVVDAIALVLNETPDALTKALVRLRGEQMDPF